MKDSLFPVPEQRSMKLLPLSAIYGGNAAGKSAFVHALRTLQRIVVYGKLLDAPFVLCPECRVKPTSYDIAFVFEGKVWNYRLSVQAGKVCGERLALVRGKKEHVIFERSEGRCELGKFFLSQVSSESDRNFLSDAAPRIQPDVLFLRWILNFKVAGVSDLIRPTLDWFREALCIVFPDSVFSGIVRDLKRCHEAYELAMFRADTGIASLMQEEVPLEQLPLEESALAALEKEPDGTTFALSDSISITMQEGKPRTYRYKATHLASDASPVHFPLELESDGTRRLLNLLPLLINDDSRPRVYVVDELVRSFHTSLTRRFIEDFRQCARRGVHRQLVFTTHDVMLLDQNLLRPDELWAVEKDEKQASSLVAFEEFIDIRKDKDIRRSYLQGRMGGVPRLSSLISPPVQLPKKS